MNTLDTQIESMKPQWQCLVAALILRGICDDYRASDDPGDETPAKLLTVGFTPKSEDKDASWGYQTGDNSYTGGAYSHPHWAVVTLCRDSNPAEIAAEIAEQISELAEQ